LVVTLVEVNIEEMGRLFFVSRQNSRNLDCCRFWKRFNLQDINYMLVGNYESLTEGSRAAFGVTANLLLRD